MRIYRAAGPVGKKVVPVDHRMRLSNTPNALSLSCLTPQVTSRIDTVAVDLYSTSVDYFRAVLELLFVFNWFFSARVELAAVKHARRHGFLRAHLFSFSTLIDVVNLGLCCTVTVFWACLAFAYLLPFSTPPRWDVYEVRVVVAAGRQK